MTTQDTYKQQARARQYIRWLRAIGRADARWYPDANESELVIIRQEAAVLETMVRNAARLPLDS